MELISSNPLSACQRPPSPRERGVSSGAVNQTAGGGINPGSNLSIESVLNHEVSPRRDHGAVAPLVDSGEGVSTSGGKPGGLWSEEEEEQKEDAAILAATVKNGLFLKSRSSAELLLIRPSGLIWRHVSLFIDLRHSGAQAAGADISQPPRHRCLSRFSRQKKQRRCGIKVTVSVAVQAVISSHKFNPAELLASNVSHSGIKPEFNCDRQEGVTCSGSRVAQLLIIHLGFPEPSASASVQSRRNQEAAAATRCP